MTISQHMVQANGLRFRTLVDGPAGGELVVLLHGFPEGAESWSRQVAMLAEAGALAVAPDMRGYGLSDAPPRAEDYAMANLVEDVAALIRSFGRDSAHIAGHDWGALVAWYFAAHYAEMTKSLTVLSVGHPTALRDATRTDEDQKERSRYVDLFLEEGKAEAVLADDGYRRLRAMLSSGIPLAAVESFVRSASRPGRLTAGLNYYRANLSGGDRWGVLDPDVKITMPTLLVWGDQDPALGRFQADETAKYVAGKYRLEVLEGAGHWLQFERADEVGRILVGVLSK
jgi:pimeloyl-ACP methyl ester carboxylesterase